MSQGSTQEEEYDLFDTVPNNVVNKVPYNEVPYNEVPYNEVPYNEVPKNEVPTKKRKNINVTNTPPSKVRTLKRERPFYYSPLKNPNGSFNPNWTATYWADTGELRNKHSTAKLREAINFRNLESGGKRSTNKRSTNKRSYNKRTRKHTQKRYKRRHTKKNK